MIYLIFVQNPIVYFTKPDFYFCEYDVDLA